MVMIETKGPNILKRVSSKTKTKTKTKKPLIYLDNIFNNLLIFNTAQTKKA